MKSYKLQLLVLILVGILLGASLGLSDSGRQLSISVRLPESLVAYGGLVFILMVNLAVLILFFQFKKGLKASREAQDDDSFGQWQRYAYKKYTLLKLLGSLSMMAYGLASFVGDTMQGIIIGLAGLSLCLFISCRNWAARRLYHVEITSMNNENDIESIQLASMDEAERLYHYQAAYQGATRLRTQLIPLAYMALVVLRFNSHLDVGPAFVLLVLIHAYLILTHYRVVMRYNR